MIGALLRWVITEYSPSGIAATFAINIAGAGLAGFVAYRMSVTEIQRVFIITGFCGGFTTFSAFAIQTVASKNVLVALYPTATLLISLLVLTIIRPSKPISDSDLL